MQFIERNQLACSQLSENLKSLTTNPNEYHLHQTDAVQWLASYEGQSFDLIFLDPPFDDGQWDQCCELINEGALLTAGALIYVESPIETKLKIPQNWHSYRSLNAGKVSAQLFELLDT